MKVSLCRFHWQDFRRGQERCFLLTNGLGGYSSLTVIGDTARNDHALFMAAEKAPNKRARLISNVEEYLEIQGKNTGLFSQEYVNRTKNQEGFRYLEAFEMEMLPTWYYQVGDVSVKKELFMLQGENTIALRYQLSQKIAKEVILHVSPLLAFVPKGKNPAKDQIFTVEENYIAGNGLVLHQKHNGTLVKKEIAFSQDLYYDQDARDGRDSVGTALQNHEICFKMDDYSREFYLIYSLDRRVDECDANTISGWIRHAKEDRQALIRHSGLKSTAGQTLAASAFQYLAHRESTGGKTILAGFPYFEDWGRDTMIALPGCTLALGLYEECKSILKTFMMYCRKGLMPNLFPEGDKDPFYNTVDAPLLFINGVYEYYKATDDEEFLKEAYPVMADIVYWYCRGTDYHIHMDWDCLVMAGEGKEQLTWMDVRINDELPTPRHGKAVEINAYWYNALKILEELSPLVGQEARDYQKLASTVKKSFLENFWMEDKGWLKDVVNGTAEEEQFRCNQVFALSMPYTMLSKEQGRRLLAAVRERLYTPVGLRTLDPADPAFHPVYGGSQPERDRAYHQGTVWTFPLGAYYRAVLACAEDQETAKEEIRQDLTLLEGWLTEGCLFHLAEIYDGEKPVASRGCYAQAWSVGEIVRVYKLIEE